MPQMDFRILQHLNVIGLGASLTLVETDVPKQIYKIDITVAIWTINIIIGAKIVSDE